VWVHGLLLAGNNSSRRDPKGQNRMPKSGARKEMNKFLTFSWYSHYNYYALSSVLFYVHCSVQVTEHFLKV